MKEALYYFIFGQNSGIIKIQKSLSVVNQQLSDCNGCGGRTRTCDLQVMSLASYQLLHSAMFFHLRVQRYEYFLVSPNFRETFFHFSNKNRIKSKI